jgi:hypothetical protein
VNALADSGSPKLKGKDQKQLIDRLNRSQAAADNGDLKKACIELSNFDNRVTNLINKVKIDITEPDPTGQSLLDDSEALQDEFC